MLSTSLKRHQLQINTKKSFPVNENPINNLFNKLNCRVPIWFLRQAGRHIPEYYEIRKKERQIRNLERQLKNEFNLLKSYQKSRNKYNVEIHINI